MFAHPCFWTRMFALKITKVAFSLLSFFFSLIPITSLEQCVNTPFLHPKSASPPCRWPGIARAFQAGLFSRSLHDTFASWNFTLFFFRISFHLGTQFIIRDFSARDSFLMSADCLSVAQLERFPFPFNLLPTGAVYFRFQCGILCAKASHRPRQDPCSPPFFLIGPFPFSGPYASFDNGDPNLPRFSSLRKSLLRPSSLPLD